jgi:hypothetical protein
MQRFNDCGCKVDRKAEEYGLSDLNEELYHRHQERGASLRDLEAYVNMRMLDRVLEDTDIVLLDGVESVYRVLAGDDVSEGKRAEIRSRLEHAGIDVDELESDFVTYQTVRKHLREALDVDTGARKTLDASDADTRIRRLQSRSEAVIAETLEQLRRGEKLKTGKLDLVMSVRVTCENCGDSYRLRELLDSGRCRCGGTLSQ